MTQGRVVCERISDSDTAGELDGMLKGFTGVSAGRNESLGYFNVEADWNIYIRSSGYTPPLRDKGSFNGLKKACNQTRTNEGISSITKIRPLVHSRYCPKRAEVLVPG